MLIQISNRCDMGCPHCMQDSSQAIVACMSQFKPCMRCKNSKHLYDDNEKMTAARKILGL